MKKNRIISILSFAAPIIIIGIIYAFIGIYPFGEKSVLINDMSSQYVELMQYFREALLGKRSFVYSFNLGMGKSLIGIIAYILSSPVNVLLIFLPKTDIQIVIMIIIFIKYGLSGLSFNYYLNKKFNRENYMTILFSLCYSLMAYNISYTLNIMWLDGVILLPVVLSGITALIRENKKKGLVISLILLIISQFYMAYIVILFSVIYFGYEIFSGEYNINPKEAVIKFVKFSGSVVLAAMVSAFLTLPTYLGLVRENSVKSLLTFKINYKFGDVLTKVFIGSFDTIRTYGNPNLYCGIIIIILVIGYFFSKNISKKEKISALSVLAVMYISLKIEFLYMIWHALDRPNWFPARFSFTICFFLIYLAYKFYLTAERDLSVKSTVITILTLIICVVFIRKKYITVTDIMINIMILCSYLIILTLKAKKKEKELLLCVVIITELFINTLLIQYDLDESAGYKYRADYIYEKKEIKEAVNTIKSKDKGIYRIDKNFATRYNNGLSNDYMALDIYSSNYNRELHNFLKQFGLSFFDKYGRYAGTTLISDALLGVKYIISDKDSDIYPLFDQTDEYDIYVNNNAFPLVISVNPEISEVLSYEKYSNLFEMQTDIINKISGKKFELFEKGNFVSEKTENLKITESEKGKVKYEKISKSRTAYIEYNIKQKKDKNITYLYIDDLKEIVTDIRLKINDEDMSGDIIDQGDQLIRVNNGDNIKIMIDTPVLEINKDKIYELDREQFENTVREIKNMQKSYSIEKMKDGYVKIKTDSDDKSILMTTIPYEQGWVVKVNGRKEEIEKMAGVFIGVKTPKGQNTVELKYEAPGLKTGIFISLTGIIILICFCFKSAFLERRFSSFFGKKGSEKTTD